MQAVSTVETLAALILQSRLRRAESVHVDVDSDGLMLLQGRLRSARIRGRDWESPAKLTARELQVSFLPGASRCPQPTALIFGLGPWMSGYSLVFS